MKTEKRVEARRRVRVRIRTKVRGSSDRPRLAIFKSGRHIYAQVIDDANGRTLAHASSLDAGMRKQEKTGAFPAKPPEKTMGSAKFGRAGLPVTIALTKSRIWFAVVSR